MDIQQIITFLAPSLVAGFTGYLAGEIHGWQRAVECVENMPLSDLGKEAGGMRERARR